MCTSNETTNINNPAQITGSSLESRWKRRSLDPASRVGNYMELSNSAVSEDASISSNHETTTSETPSENSRAQVRKVILMETDTFFRRYRLFSSDNACERCSCPRCLNNKQIHVQSF